MLRSLLSFDDAAVAARFLRKLPSFLRHPVTVEEARATLGQRIERREADFLALLKRFVYENPTGRYRQLLASAGCQYGDVERLVSQDGVERTLQVLFRSGVYLTVDEFKGRRPVVRGGLTIRVHPNQLRNPGSALHVPARSSGSRGGGTPVLIDLAYLRDRAVNTCLTVDARGGNRWLHANWGVPGASGIIPLLVYNAFGSRPVR